jgi:hypothetical protein
MDPTIFIQEVVSNVVTAATELLSNLPVIFEGVVTLVYNSNTEAFTGLGVILLATAGFSLAWSGIRFIFAFVSRLLNKTRAGR